MAGTVRPAIGGENGSLLGNPRGYWPLASLAVSVVA